MTCQWLNENLELLVAYIKLKYMLEVHCNDVEGEIQRLGELACWSRLIVFHSFDHPSRVFEK